MGKAIHLELTYFGTKFLEWNSPEIIILYSGI